MHGKGERKKKKSAASKLTTFSINRPTFLRVRSSACCLTRIPLSYLLF
jgi:hypothetical protein